MGLKHGGMRTVRRYRNDLQVRKARRPKNILARERTKKAEINWQDGKQEGLNTRWYENGQKYEKVNLKDGVPHGQIISWHENGQKKLEGNFKEGKKHGVSVYYDKNGKEIVNGRIGRMMY